MLRVFIGMFFIFLFGSLKSQTVEIRDRIELNGKWLYSLQTDRETGVKPYDQSRFSKSLILPGTLDENKIGNINTDSSDLHLFRELEYTGPAYFQREVTITQNWKGKNILLIMERTRVTKVWVDTMFMGFSNRIFSKQEYDLTDALSPGIHTITIEVNNDPSLVPLNGSHGRTEDTQTNWNGILGEFYLESSSKTHIDKTKIIADIRMREIKVRATILADKAYPDANLLVAAETFNTIHLQKVGPKSIHCSLNPGINTIELNYPLGKDAILWSEYAPGLYKLNYLLTADETVIDSKTDYFGLREFKVHDTQFTINGTTTFLRGKHDAAVFPLTAYSPMDTASWIKIFRIAQSYGINCYRFHTWCPPEAAFLAADICGIYLQPELPNWWDFHVNDSLQIDFNKKEGKAIFDDYGNHPSFVMFALGNEIYQERDSLKALVDYFRSYDDSIRLIAQGSNNFGGNPSQAVGDDFWVTFRTANEKEDCSTDVRTSISFVDAKEGGLLNTLYPSTAYNFTDAIKHSTVPVVGHEIGQYQVYPDFSELTKYTGILKPINLELYKRRLYAKGLGGMESDFQKASGALSVLCYRADIETALRTPGFGGFHLLDLQDYPGQGTALVGLLDAFMETKGLVTPLEFSKWNSKIVVLLEMDKYVWTNKEQFAAKIQVANYDIQRLENKNIIWEIVDEDSHNVYGKGKVHGIDIENGGISDITSVKVRLSAIDKATKLKVIIKIEGTPYCNEYPVWVFPAIDKMEVPVNILVVNKLSSELVTRLINGASVLLFPDGDEYLKNTTPCQFIPEFWNYKMFTGFAEKNGKGFSPGTMGILTNPTHPVFKSFPTEFYTNWQWWPIVKYARPLILDNFDMNVKPIVRVIDNINRNHSLALMLEYKIGNGKLLICNSNLLSHQEFPEVKALYSSMIEYMNSPQFQPQYSIDASKLKLFY